MIAAALFGCQQQSPSRRNGPYPIRVSTGTESKAGLTPSPPHFAAIDAVVADRDAVPESARADSVRPNRSWSPRSDGHGLHHTFWFKPDSIFGLSLFTTFISTSPELT
jgi:hypothetical protein